MGKRKTCARTAAIERRQRHLDGLANRPVLAPAPVKPKFGILAGLPFSPLPPFCQFLWRGARQRDAAHGSHQDSWGPDPQPEEHQPRPAAQPAGGDHGAVGVGQVVARVRHALRGGAAPLRGIAVGLRTAVPATDGKAGRGPDRRAVAGHLDRAEGHQPQPALHRRHRHRDPRLPAPAVRPRRHALLPGARPAARSAKRVADGGCRAGAAGRHQADDPGARGGQPQGRARGPVRGDAGARLRALPRPLGRRHGARGAGQGLRGRHAAQAEEERQAHHRRGGRPRQGQPGAQAAAGRVVRDRAAPGRRPRRRAGDGHGQGACLQLQVRLPDLRVFAAGAGAAPVLVQQPDGRLPALRRPGPDHLLRPEARGGLPQPVAGLGRDQGLGPPQPVLFPDAAKPGGVLRFRHRHAVRRAAQGCPGRRAAGLGPAADPVHVHQRARPHHGARARLRGHHPQPGAAIQGNRLHRRARRVGQVPEQPGLPRMRGHAPAPRGAPRQDRRRRPGPLHLRDQRLAAARCAHLFPHAEPARRQARDRRQDRPGDHLAAELPEQRRARLPVAGAQRRYALRRRSAAHPPGLADRLGPDRRDVCARRALHRPAPARQRPPDRHPQAPARPRQLGAGGRAR